MSCEPYPIFTGTDRDIPDDPSGILHVQIFFRVDVEAWLEEEYGDSDIDLVCHREALRDCDWSLAQELTGWCPYFGAAGQGYRATPTPDVGRVYVTVMQYAGLDI